MKVSIIICTQNRAPSLAKTLQSFGRVNIPSGWNPELIVVDNGSTDETASVVKDARSKFTLHYIYESKRGLSNARNAGLAAAEGEAILFTDDDVIPTEKWLEKMSTPLLRGECDGVVGSIQLAEHLLRSWMQPMHKVWLAAPDALPMGFPELIGANMGFHRKVLEQVPAFDPELGSGALGFAEETLFSEQLRSAGCRLRFLAEAAVVHHPDPSRLLRRQWLAAACKHGRSLAYVLHHWRHQPVKTPTLRICCLTVKLYLRRILQPPPPLDGEGCPTWEMSYVTEIEKCRQFIRERRRPRNYVRHGLRKQAIIPAR